MVTSTRYHLERNLFGELHFDGDTLRPNKCVTNLGVKLNSCMNMEDHVNAICKTVNLNAHNIWKTRKYLDKKSAETLVVALIASRLDYGNSLLCNVPSYLLQRLQRLLNTAARIVMYLPKHEHISRALRELHWLPVRKRIDYKLLLITYKCLNGIGPSYLSELLYPYVPKMNLRSSTQGLLCVPNTRLKSFGDRGFSAVVPKLWNDLPTSVKNVESLEVFKANLKTYLFRN